MHEQLIELEELLELLRVSCIAKVRRDGDLWDVDTCALEGRLQRLLLGHYWTAPWRGANIVAGYHQCRRRLLALHLHLLLLGLWLLLRRSRSHSVRCGVRSWSIRLLGTHR